MVKNNVSFKPLIKGKLIIFKVRITDNFCIRMIESHPVQREGIYALEVSYSSKKLRSICEMQSELRSLFEDDDLKRLQARLSDLDACSTVKDIIVGKPKEIYHGNCPMYQISFGINNHIIIEPNHIKNPVKLDGNIDWKLITRVKIISIGGNQYE